MADIASGTTAIAAASGTLALTTVMAVTPFGVSLTTLMLGGGCFYLGAAARTGVKLAKALEGSATAPLNFYRQIAALLCMIPVAATASCVVFLGAKVANIDADAALGGALFLAGLRGPEGMQWIADGFANVFTRLLPAKREEPKP